MNCQKQNVLFHLKKNMQNSTLAHTNITYVKKISTKSNFYLRRSKCCLLKLFLEKYLYINCRFGIFIDSLFTSLVDCSPYRMYCLSLNTHSFCHQQFFQQFFLIPQKILIIKSSNIIWNVDPIILYVRFHLKKTRFKSSICNLPFCEVLISCVCCRTH